MECDICSQGYTPTSEPLCVSCGRTSVYLARLEIARVLLEKENLAKQVQAVIDLTSKPSQADKSVLQAQEVWRAEILHNEKTVVKIRTEQTRTATESLRKENEGMKEEISRRRATLVSRKEVLEKVVDAVPARRRNIVDPLSVLKDERTKSFHTVHNRSTKTRAFLCREAATLLRLRQKRRKSRDGEIKEYYLITGNILPDLRDINNVRCTDLSAVLSSMAHLLVLVSFYLGVRLPAEITSPHRDYPMPTINTPTNSYLGHKVPFPGSGSLGTTPGSPFSSKYETKAPYRPRPLFIGSDDLEEKVAQFAKREPIAFNFFLEGISLLAWNIAWITRSQGYSAGTTSWEDICDMGRNMWQLTQSPTQSPTLLRVLSSQNQREIPQRSISSDNTKPEAQRLNTTSISLGRLGQTSHLSAHSYLGQAEYLENTRNWKYSHWTIISDSLKKHLMTEMNNAEWEVVEEKEWDDGGEQFDEAVFVRARGNNTTAPEIHGHAAGLEFDDARSIMTTRTSMEDAGVPESSSAATAAEGNKPRGVSGWTKLKNRDKDKK